MSSSNTTPPPLIEAVLALRPPLATSTRTDLAPSFKLLRSLVNSVYGASGCRGLEPGLWRAQLCRAILRSAALIQAVWTKLGGENGVIVDDEGEGGRGVLRIQGLLSDLQIFVGALTSVQDPLATFLLDQAAYSRTQTTVGSFIKKVGGLITHYKIEELVPTPLDQWSEEDSRDKAEDLAALPMLIAKSRPSKQVIHKFEADLAAREQAEVTEQSTDLAKPLNDTGSQPSSPHSPPLSARRRLSIANSGLSGAKRSDFLRFVYSQNPGLIADNTSLDTAVAEGTAAVSSLGSLPKSSQLSSLSASDDGRRRTRQSLVQQRISSFGSPSNPSVPPLPSTIALPTGIGRRIVSDHANGPGTRKTWTVDMSGLDAIHRRTSGSMSRPPSTLPSAPQVSITAPPVRWSSSSHTSRASSVEPPEGLPLDQNESQVSAVAREAPLSTPSEATSDDPSKAPAVATFAEQAAAIVAARNRRTISQSSVASSIARSKDLLSHRSDSTNHVVTLATTPEASVTPLPSDKSLDEQPCALALCEKLALAPPALDHVERQDDAAQVVTAAPGANPSPLPPPPDSPTSILGSKPPQLLSSTSSITSSSIPLAASSLTSARAPSFFNKPLTPEPGRLSRSNSTRTSISVRSSTVHPSRLPLAPQTTDFEIVPDLIEHVSLLDVILTPSPPHSSKLRPSPPDQKESSEESTLPEQPTSESPSRPLASGLQPDSVTVAASTEETSLLDLLQRASMFESWKPNHDAEQLARVTTSTSSCTETIQPVPASDLPDTTKTPPQILGNSVKPFSPPISPRVSPQFNAPLSPPSTGGLTSEFLVSRSTPSASPDISVPHLVNTLTFEAPLSQQPSIYSARLGDEDPTSPTRSISGHSWATSFMSVPQPSELHVSGLASSVNRRFGGRSTSNLSRTIPVPSQLLRSGWRILCLDGGGIRGLSMLYIVREVMVGMQVRLGLRITPLPCECFDMICGVGTGGIIAILLGRLRLDIDTAIDAYLEIVRHVFGQGKGVIAALMRKSRFSAHKLEAAMRAVIERKFSRGKNTEVPLGDTEGRCKTFVMAMRVSDSSRGVGGLNAKGSVRTLRSYANLQYGADRCTVYQAARATTAAPLFFKPVQVDTDPLGSVPNHAGLNNPSLEALGEARALQPERAIDSLVSIGTGRGLELGQGRIARACAEIAESCQNAAEAVEATAREEGWLDNYTRFNVEKNEALRSAGANGASEEEKSEWDQVELVKARTTEYILSKGKEEFQKRLGGLVDSWKQAYEGDMTFQAEGGYINQMLRTSMSDDKLKDSKRKYSMTNTINAAQQSSRNKNGEGGGSSNGVPHLPNFLPSMRKSISIGARSINERTRTISGRSGKGIKLPELNFD